VTPRTLHVSADTGSDTGDGAESAPFRTISAAAAVAMPGDTVLVARGTYREQVSPPRSGTAEHPITFLAELPAQTVITGSDIASDWEQVNGNVWRYQINNSRFGTFNPYADIIRGDWFDPLGRVHHTGCVYHNGEWLVEATQLDELNTVSHPDGLWYATVEGDADNILSLGEIRPVGGTPVPAESVSFRYGGSLAKTDVGSYSTGFKVGDWLRFEGVDVGAQCQALDIDVATDIGGGGRIEFREDTRDGRILGVCDIEQGNSLGVWRRVTVPILPVSGKVTLVVRFTTVEYESGTTKIYAQFPDTDPTTEDVEINVRQTVFYPEKNFINYIHVSGFTLRNAATNWAPPSSEQTAIIGTNWSRGWVIENNVIHHSKCSGLSLGKYGDGSDNTNDAGAADPYTQCVQNALINGWNKATIGSHTVRNNVIHDCEQTGIVGSMGCAFSTVTGNNIYNIDSRRLFSGAEQAGIKLHGAIDALIMDNHIYRSGLFGLWLDWMCQGAQVSGNLFHDNDFEADLFLEMQHGPLLVANNILLSTRAIALNSKGVAFAHNLFAGQIRNCVTDLRRTPYHPAHTTEIAGLADSTAGDHRFYNNVFGAHQPDTTGLLDPDAPWDITLDGVGLACFAHGNLFAHGVHPSHFDESPVTGADIQPLLTQQPDGWYLTVGILPTHSVARRLVTSELLGVAVVPGVRYENADGSDLNVDTDYFSSPRGTNPAPGPFEHTVTEPVRVWPKATGGS